MKLGLLNNPKRSAFDTCVFVNVVSFLVSFTKAIPFFSGKSAKKCYHYVTKIW